MERGRGQVIQPVSDGCEPSALVSKARSGPWDHTPGWVLCLFMPEARVFPCWHACFIKAGACFIHCLIPSVHGSAWHTVGPQVIGLNEGIVGKEQQRQRTVQILRIREIKTGQDERESRRKTDSRQ